MSSEISVEQLSRKIGDARRSLSAMCDRADAVQSRRLSLQTTLQTCRQSEVAEINEELGQLKLEHSRLIEKQKIAAVHIEELEHVFGELRCSP